MNPDGGTTGLEGRHALGQQNGDQTSQHIAGAGRRQIGAAAAVEDQSAIGRRDDRLGPLQNDKRCRQPGRRQGAGFDPAAKVGKCAVEFTLIRGDDPLSVGWRAVAHDRPDGPGVKHLVTA